MGILQNIIKSINTAIDNIDFSPYQLISNKSTDGTLAENSDTIYPSQKAVKTYADTKQSALGYTAENQANKENTTLDTSSTKYPTNNLVKTNLDLKANTSDVNTALGLKQNLLFDSDFLELQPLNGYFYQNSFVDDVTPNSGKVLASTSGSGASNSNLIFLNGGTNTVRKPMANITSNSTGVSILRYTQNSCQLGSNCSVAVESHVSLRASTATGYTSVYIGIDGSGTASAFPTNDALTSTGLYWRWNPTLNSGKWQLIKNIAGVITVLLNTNYTMTDDIIYKLGVKYVKSSDTAYFYYNRVLIHTATSVNFTNNVEVINIVGINTSNAQAVTKAVHWHQTTWLFKYA